MTKTETGVTYSLKILANNFQFSTERRLLTVLRTSEKKAR